MKVIRYVGGLPRWFWVDCCPNGNGRTHGQMSLGIRWLWHTGHEFPPPRYEPTVGSGWILPEHNASWDALHSFQLSS